MSLVSDRPVGRVATVLRSILRLYRDRDIPFLAGSVAYSAFVSVIPLVLLVLIAASVLGGAAFREYVLGVTEQYLTPAALGVIEQSIPGAADSLGFSLFGLVALLWAVLKVFRTLDKAFSDLYNATIDAGILEQLRDGVVVLGAMTAAVLTMVGVGALVAFAPSVPLGFGLAPPVLRVVGFVALVVGLTVAFLPMYYVFPDVDVTVREVLPGAVVAAVGWTLLQGGFQVYVSLTSASRLYGVVGGVILFVTWLYFGAVVVLLGAATNVVLAGREPPRPGAATDRSTTGA